MSDDQLYQTDQLKIGFDGNKRNVYESWQFTSSYVDENNVFLIESGWKFVRESACHKRRLSKVKYYPFLNGKFYRQRTNFISLADWEFGIAKCINEDINQAIYNWYGETINIMCWQTQKNKYEIQINSDKHIYRFSIRVEPNY